MKPSVALQLSTFGQGTVNEAVVPGQNISPGNSAGVFDMKV